MFIFLATWLVLAATFALADVPWDKNFIPHRTRAQHQLSASRPLRDLEVTIAAYDHDRQQIGWFAQSPDEAHYRLSQTAAEAEMFVLPNFGPSIGNSLRIEGSSSAFLGSALQLDIELAGGIGENCTNYVAFSRVAQADDHSPREHLVDHGFQTSNWIIPSKADFWTTFEFFNADQTRSHGQPRFYWKQSEATVYAATHPAHISAGMYTTKDRIYLRFESA